MVLGVFEQAVITIEPAMTHDEALTTTKVHSAAGVSRDVLAVLDRAVTASIDAQGSTSAVSVANTPSSWAAARSRKPSKLPRRVLGTIGNFVCCRS